MYVLLSSIVEMLNAAGDIIVLLADMGPIDSRELAAIEKHLLTMIRCALDSYEQTLDRSLKSCQDQKTIQNKEE